MNKMILIGVMILLFSNIVYADCSGLVSWWKFDNNVLDSQNGNDGMRYNFTNGYVEGAYNNSLEFNSTAEQFVDIGNDSSLNFGSGNFSIELWLYKNTLSSNLIDKIDDAGKGYSLVISSDTIDFSIGNETNIIECLSYEIDNETWYHIIGVKTGNSCSIYINGTNYTEIIIEDSVGDTNTIVNLTVGYDVGMDYFNGTLDNARIWNKVLTSDEILDLYENALSCEIEPTYNSSSLSCDYCFNSVVLIHNKTYIYDDEEHVLSIPEFCENGCDNITMVCNPPEYQQELINFLIIFIIVIIFMIIFVKKRRR